MYVDKQLLLSDSQDLSQTAAAYSSTNIIDLGKASFGDHLAQGKKLAIVITVDEAFTSASSTATVVFSVVTNNDEDLTTSATTLYATPALLVTLLTKGKVMTLPIPEGRMLSTARYLGVTYTIGTDTTTAGTCSAFVAFDY